MATLDHMTPLGLPSYAIYEDTEHEPTSPSDMFAGDVSFGSELSPMARAEDPVPSIGIDLEQDFSDEPEPYQSSYTSRTSHSHSRRHSGYSLISALPSEPGIAPADHYEGKHSPRKERSRFRNPESVRAMQMSSPRASPYDMKGAFPVQVGTQNKNPRSERSVSRRSRSHRESLGGSLPPPTPQQAPLVLLHVTILPMQLPYAHDLMGRIMPAWLVENYRLLEEKLQDIVLMRRGLLIPHPRDEYDLLEERILESLELKPPRLLRCGHFFAPDDDPDKDDVDCASSIDDATGRGSRMSGGTMTEDHECKDVVDSGDASMCMDCHRELKKPGSRRWDIRIYAANGLMRSEAWNAAWSEMERCDVEISPWVPDAVRKDLEKRVLEEQEAEKRKRAYAEEVKRRVEQDNAEQEELKAKAAEQKRKEDKELHQRLASAAAALEKSLEEKDAEKHRFEQVLEEKIEEAKESIRLEFECQAQLEANSVAERLRTMEEALLEQQKRKSSKSHKSPSHSHSPADPNIYLDLRSVSRGRRGYTNRRQRVEQLPLGTLLSNYIHRQLTDRKNWLIVLLSALLVIFAMGMEPVAVPASGMLDAHNSIVPAAPVPTVTVTELQSPVAVLPSVPVPAELSGAPQTSPAVFEEEIVSRHTTRRTFLSGSDTADITTSPSLRVAQDLLAGPAPVCMRDA